MKAVVMGGGQGSRLRPLTCNRPKPLVPVCNKPVMEYSVELLRRHGFKTLLVTLHYLADEVMAYFGNGSDWEIQMLYSVEDEPLGTAGSIKKIEEYLGETFLVLSGDALTDFDLAAAIRFHKEKGAAATVVLTRVDNPLEFGVVITDAESRIVRFLEKPTWGEVFSDTINTGIYILEPEVLDLMEPNTVYDFSNDLFPRLMERKMPLFGYVAEGYWCDIGNLDQYRQAHQDMLEGRINHAIPGELLSEGIWVGAGTTIHPGAQLKAPVVIGRNCRIRENARLFDGSVVGDNCIVEEGASLARDILWNNTFVGRNVHCSGSAVCRHVTLKENVSLGEGAVVGDNVFIGRGATVQGDVKIWPGKNVEPGANVSLSLVWGRKWPGSLFGEEGISGLGNIEITPEYALKLGAAYGATLNKGAVVFASRDAHPATRMTCRAIICGLVSVGVTVRDLQDVPSAITRNLLKNSADAMGAIHCRVSLEDPRSIQLEFFDERGINLDRPLERKIENRFFREDFRRTTMDEVGLIEFPSRIVERYLEAFMASLRVQLVRQAGFKVVIDYGYGTASLALPTVLGNLGCEIVSLNAYPDSERCLEQAAAPERALEQLSNIVRTLKADLGVRMDAGAQRMRVVDENGRLLSEAELLVLFCLLVGRQIEGALIAVPVTAPRVVAKVAKESGGRVIWTKSDARSLMHTATLGENRIAFAGTPAGGYGFPSFSPGFDAMYAFARLLEMMAVEKAPLSEMVSWSPPFAMAHATMPCEFQARGRIMRLLIEQSINQRVEMIDGIKFFEEGGWVLVMPDTSDPELHLWAEADTTERCEALLERYRERLQAMLATALDPEPAPGRSRRIQKTGPSTPVPEDRAFHFWTPGRYLGVRARTYREFLDTLHYIDPASLSYHLDRGDFSNWVEHALNDTKLAEGLRGLVKREGAPRPSGEDLRRSLLDLFTRSLDRTGAKKPEPIATASDTGG